MLWIGLWMICVDSRSGAQQRTNAGAGKYAMTPEEITALAVERYTPEGYEGPDDCLFALLVDVADAYTRRQGSSLSTVESVLDTVCENIAERRDEAPAD